MNFKLFKTIWSESCDGYPDQESDPIFLPFVPFMYAYIWLNFYRNGCFSKITPKYMTEHRKWMECKCGVTPYYTLFIN